MPEPTMTYVAYRNCGDLVGLHDVVCPGCGQPHPRFVDQPALPRPVDEGSPQPPDEPWAGKCRPVEDAQRRECA